MPKQALVIADYIMYMADYVVEMNIPDQQIEKLEEISEQMKQEELPKTREEFEGRALLYHILMDLEEFLVYKKRFVNGLDEKKLRIYWKQEMEQKIVQTSCRNDEKKRIKVRRNKNKAFPDFNPFY